MSGVRRAIRAGLLMLAAVSLGVLVACRPQPQVAEEPADSGPAQRIITLAPHLAELVFSAGAGERLVGVVAFSDFPAEVKSVPQVGDAFRVDYEQVMSLKPDLVLAWTSGNPPQTVQRLRELGIRVMTLEPESLEDIATHIQLIARLAGTQPAAAGVTAGYRARLAALRDRYQSAAPVSVFVQLAERPYYTVTDRHFFGQGLRLCGGRNVFGDLPGLTAIVSPESILEVRPQVIVASDMGGEGADPLARWAQWPELPAVKSGNLYLLNADLLSRPSVRILDGIGQLCRDLDRARN